MTPQPIEGLVIAGTRPRCGKTVLTAGIAGTMRSVGLQVQTVKPLTFSEIEKPNLDQAFLDLINRPLQAVTPICAPSPHELSTLDWNRVIDICRKMAYPTLIESPGTVAAPLKFQDQEVVDVGDFARVLGVKILLVTPKSPHLYSELVPALVYLLEQGANVIGWAGIETQPVHTPHWDVETLYISNRYRVPFLGELPYSPSISVEAMQQGNLIRLTEAGVDLLPIQSAMNMLIP